MSGRKRALEKKRKRRKVLPGFPWRGQFRTKEEIEAYFAGDKIQCLLCGKWYQRISGPHLSHSHNMTDDEYRQRYGLPWKRGLTAKTLRKKQSKITKQLIKEGRIHLLDGKDEQIQRKSKMSPQRPLQPYVRDLYRKRILATHGRTIPWQRKDYEAILGRMQEQQRTLNDVCRDPDLPGVWSWRMFVKEHPEFAAKLQQVSFTLPYSLQLRSGKVSPQFRIDCQRLRAQGMVPKDIAKNLEVSLIFVERALSEAEIRPKSEPVLTITQMHQLAKRRGGKCLSETYINARTKLLWECAQGHQWKATPTHIKQGTWCPICARIKQAAALRLDIEDMHQLAKRRGGKCLSGSYINVRTKLLWECEQGHRWKAAPKHIKGGYWCPYCAGNVKKTIELPSFPWRGVFQTKEEIEAYFAGDKIQCLLCGKWYQRVSGRHLSCIHDMTEHEYRQRYGLPWGRGLTAEQIRKKSSETTKRLIAEGRLQAIDGQDEQIQRKSKMNPQKPLQPYAREIYRRQMLATHGRTTPWQRKDYGAILSRMQEQQRTLNDVCRDPDLPGLQSWKLFVKEHPEFAAKLQQVSFTLPYSLQLKGGKVSPQFRIDCQRLRAQGMVSKDIAKALAVSLTFVERALSGARIRLKPQPETIQQMQQLAKRRGGKCLSDTYINTSTKLLWECEQGHQWEARPVDIKYGHWCPHCAGNIKRTIEDMQRIAKRRSGKCLSKEYINTDTTLLWECEQGHQWKAAPNNIKKGGWCPHCAGNVKKTIEDMQRLAKRRGGTCLSDTYINTKTKLLWECEQGHQWKATPSVIKRGCWCPYCAGRKRKGTREKMR